MHEEDKELTLFISLLVLLLLSLIYVWAMAHFVDRIKMLILQKFNSCITV